LQTGLVGSLIMH